MLTRILLATAVVVGVLLARDHLAPPSVESFEQHRAAEAGRLRAHFDSVDRELRDANTSMFSANQRSTRSALIAWLRDYRDAGVFPENDRFPDRAMPFFRDSRGVLCAMAYLVARSGRTDIVDRIARTRNTAFIPQLADDTALAGWLRGVGLTVEEAARIQPTYGPAPEQRIRVGYAVLSAAASGAALAAMGFNVFSPTAGSGWLGLGAGALAGLVGLANIEAEADTKALAIANIAVGLSSMVLSVRGFSAGARERRQARTREPNHGQRFQMSVVPVLATTAGTPGLGIVVQAKF